MQQHDLRVGMIGGGSWATALVKIVLENTSHVQWYVRSPQIRESLAGTGQNPAYLQNVVLDHRRLTMHSTAQALLESSDLVILCVPSAFLHGLIGTISADQWQGKLVFSAIKGIVPEFNAIPARYLHKTFGIPYEHIGIISGPCHAEEVAMEKLSYLTVSCLDEDRAEQAAGLLSCSYINTIVSTDLYGTELAAVLKNIYSILAGMADGLGYGVNFQAVLVANAIQEMERFLDAVSPVHRDVNNSAYLGDLLVTAYSDLSRNRQLGKSVGQGLPVLQTIAGMDMVAEGYYAVASVMEINRKFGVHIPMAQLVYQVLHGGADVRQGMQRLSETLR
jgi:glycerol-3-phosphate dehydrogenase (NAD(P)+)